MKCATFRENHGAFIDDLLDECDVVAMQCHIAECAQCAAHDARVRRGMLLFRNLPQIEPSPGFGERLSMRLCQERLAARTAALAPTVAARGPGLGVFAAAAAGVAVVGYLAAATVARHELQRELTLPPVVATRLADPAPMVAEAAPSPVSSPAIMASVAAGMPIWPAALLVDEAPLQFATSEFQLASFGR